MFPLTGLLRATYFPKSVSAPRSAQMLVFGAVMATMLVSPPATAGPPVLPPLPGERPPEPEPTPVQPTVESPASPAPAPAPSSKRVTKPRPAPAQPAPTAPTEDLAPPPAAAADTEVQPPQPEPSQPPLSDEVGGEPLPPATAPDADAAPSLPRLPPPPRPPYRGTGVFIGAGVTFSIALAEQIVAHVLVKRRCTDPVQRRIDEDRTNEPTDPTIDADGNGIPDILEIPDEAERAGELVIDCIPGVIPALALRVHSDLGLLATIGLATAGGMLRARQAAHDDVFGGKTRRTFTALRITGISLIGTGIVTWFATGAGSWGWLTSCDSGRCVTRARLMNFLTRDISALMIAGGGATLGFSEAYRRSSDRYERDRAWSVGPAIGRTWMGLSIAGRL